MQQTFIEHLFCARHLLDVADTPVDEDYHRIDIFIRRRDSKQIKTQKMSVLKERVT